MRRVLFLAAALGAASATVGAVAQEADRDPDWLRRPSASAIAEYYPDDAIDKSLSGRVKLLCIAATDGFVKDCVVVSESPVGLGFGEAALKMAPKEFRMKPAIRAGKPVESEITIPLVMIAGSSDAPYVVLDPVWEAAPTFEDMAVAWPAGVDDLETGTAALRCELASAGHLRRCVVAGGTGRGVCSETRP